MAIEVNHVDPRVKRTRKLLQQAFMELFQEKGFDAITIQDIADRATVNRATFYAHFTDKYALLDAIIREQFQSTVTAKFPSAPSWSVASLRLLIQAAFDFFGEFHHDCKPSDKQLDPLIERSVQEELAEILLSWLKQARAAGSGRRARLETVAAVMSWAIFGTAVQWSSERTLSAEEMTNQVLLVLTEGVAHLAPGLLPD